MRRSAVLLVIGLAVAGAIAGMSNGCSRNERQAVRAAALDEETNLPEAWRLAAVVDSAEAQGFAGSVLAMRAGRILLHRGVGWVDDARTHRTDLVTPYSIGSVRRGFIAAAILALREDGVLVLDESVQRLFPGAPEGTRDITVGMLLRHTAGLATASDLQENGDLRATVKTILETPLQAPPGVRFQESPAGYMVLARVVEMASGKPFAEFLQERLLKPAGLEKTILASSPGGGGSANVLSTTADLYRWYTAMFETDVVLSPESRTLLVTSHARRGALEVGYGWFITATRRETRAISNLSDTLEPSGAILTWFPDEDAVIILLGTATPPEDHNTASRIAARLEYALFDDGL